jgi:hypothetical protein
MLDSRRRWMVTTLGALGVLAAKPLFSGEMGQSRSVPKAQPYPNGRDPNAVPGNDEPSRLDPKAIEQANQKKLREDINKLYEMVSELKEQVEKTDANSTFSVSVVKKAQQIEKLAKQIKELARS